jgi:hypothetical protein
MNWFEMKEWLEQSLGLHQDALHVHAGVLGQLLIARVLRRSLRSLVPWLAVLLAVLANEYYDLRFEVWPGNQRGWQYAEAARDVWNTMLLPTLLLALARFAPGLLTAKRPVRSRRQSGPWE